MQRMDVGAPIQQQSHHLASRRGHRDVERRTSGAVGAVHELRRGPKEREHARSVTRGRGEVNLMIGWRVSRRGPAPKGARLLEQDRDAFVPSVSGHR